MIIKVLERQSILDVALQTSGGMEAAFELATRNDLPITAALERDAVLEIVAPVDRATLGRYQNRALRPATDVSPTDIATVPYGGIGYMGIDIDFIVS